MATTVGTENTIEKLVRNLMLLEEDAIAAYDETIEKLDDPEAKTKIAEFRNDHYQHRETLHTIADELGIEKPTEGDMKQMLTTGKVKLANLFGDSAILRAMVSNENDTVTAYERASRHDDAIPKSRAFFEKALADEERHRAWMEQHSRRE